MEATADDFASRGEGSLSYSRGDHSFTLQAVMEMQKTLGKLEHAVNLLVESEAATKAKVSRIEKIIYAAGVVLLIFLTVSGWMISTAKDLAMTYFRAQLDPPKVTATPASPRVEPPELPRPPAPVK